MASQLIRVVSALFSALLSLTGIGHATAPLGATGRVAVLEPDGALFTPGPTYRPFGRLSAAVVGWTARPGGGWWEVASDGGVFTRQAPFFGSLGRVHLAQPIVGMASTPDGQGYWLVASDGGIFSFGDARFHGSLGRAHLAEPIVGMASTPDGRGYWLVAGDGGVFAFGNARYYGSLGRQSLAQPVVGMASASDGRGYWLLASDGHVHAFGHSEAFGSVTRGDLPAVSIAPSGAGGYVTAFADGTVWRFAPGRRPAVVVRLRVPSVYVAAAIQKAVSARAIAVALAQTGKPYIFGGNGPYSFDCSGLTKFAYAAAGVTLPRTAAAQFAAVPHVPLAQAEPGDLLFFYPGVDHVGIYLGDGLMVDAPHAGASVRIEAFEPGFGPVMGVGRPG